MKSTIYVLMVASAFTLSGCGDSGGSKSTNTKTEVISYEYDVNGCKTGKQEFNSTEALCKGLQNETLNNGCAVSLREANFKNNCAGQTFKPFFDIPVEHHDNIPKSEAKNANSDSKGANAGDELKGDMLVRTLGAGQGSVVLYKNPTGESASTLVYCLAEGETAEKVLEESRLGGLMLAKGSGIVVKNDTGNSFSDGAKLRGEYIQILCR